MPESVPSLHRLIKLPIMAPNLEIMRILMEITYKTRFDEMTNTWIVDTILIDTFKLHIHVTAQIYTTCLEDLQFKRFFDKFCTVIIIFCYSYLSDKKHRPFPQCRLLSLLSFCIVLKMYSLCAFVRPWKFLFFPLIVM